jgi:phosphocarrier protein HPr
MVRMEITEKFQVQNKLGLHLRAAAELAKACSKFKCSVQVKNHHHQADGKSVINLLVLSATKGTELTIYIDGEDAWAARNSIQELFDKKFGEKE